jgi:flagellar basal-body rod modification protein FlgD
MATAGIYHTMSALTGATAESGSSGSSGSSSSSSASITANDFLTLLVTELQNQDPTANTDPNEYINQLVEVNSLEQLIDIHQTLSGALGTTKTTSGGAVHATTGANALSQTASTAISGAMLPGNVTHPAITAGNLNVPDVSNAAQRVANALNGQSLSTQSTPTLSGAK